MLEERIQTLRGRRVFTRVTTDAPASAIPAVLIHGAVISSDYFVPLARALAPALRCWLFDLPGFGRSEKLEHMLRVDEAAEWIVEWMRVNGIARAHVIGNSLGAQVAAALAQHHPGLVETLTLIGPTVDPSARSRHRQLARLAVDAFIESPRLHLIWFRSLARCGPLRAWRTLGVALDDAIERRLPAITCAALVIRGGRDPLVPREWTREVARILRATYVEIPRESHGAHFRAASSVARSIETLL